MEIIYRSIYECICKGGVQSFLCIAFLVRSFYWLCRSDVVRRKRVKNFLSMLVMMVALMFGALKYLMNIILLLSLLWMIFALIRAEYAAEIVVNFMQSMKKILSLSTETINKRDLANIIMRKRWRICNLFVVVSFILFSNVSKWNPDEIDAFDILMYTGLAISTAALMGTGDKFWKSAIVLLINAIFSLMPIIYIVDCYFLTLPSDDLDYIARLILLLNAFFIGVVLTTVILLVGKILGGNNAKFIKLFLCCTLGYAACKIFLECSSSYYIYVLRVSTLKNIIDSILQVAAFGSIFCYAGATLFKEEYQNNK